MGTHAIDLLACVQPFAVPHDKDEPHGQEQGEVL
jgi:hypothetical protein